MIRPFSTASCKMARDQPKCRPGRVWSGTKISPGREMIRTSMVLALYQLENGLNESKWCTLKNFALILRLSFFLSILHLQERAAFNP